MSNTPLKGKDFGEEINTLNFKKNIINESRREYIPSYPAEKSPAVDSESTEEDTNTPRPRVGEYNGGGQFPMRHSRGKQIFLGRSTTWLPVFLLLLLFCSLPRPMKGGLLMQAPPPPKRSIFVVHIDFIIRDLHIN